MKWTLQFTCLWVGRAVGVGVFVRDSEAAVYRFIRFSKGSREVRSHDVEQSCSRAETSSLAPLGPRAWGRVGA